MKKYVFLLLGLLLANVNGFTSQGDENYWQQFVHYKMNVTLDPDTHILTGDETILYKNNSPDTLFKIYLHLYPNAFRDANSTMAKEAKAMYYSSNVPKEDRGWINIQQFSIKMKGASKEQATNEVSAFNVDDTILEAALPQPLPPQGEMTLQLKFEEKVRKIMGRAGYRNNQYDFAQWYPKVVVYDENGWHPEQFHMSGEFYGEFGTFDVTMNLPMNFIVCATGELTAGDPGWDLVEVDTTLTDEEWQEQYKTIKTQLDSLASDKAQMRTATFHAENVHDFAWAASSDFLYEKGNWDGIPIHVFYRSGVKSRWSKVVAERGQRTLGWLSAKFGRYPYPQLTIMHGLLGGGMEYPMLVMNASESEGLIVHEVGHIYFYGILGNNEQAEAWMDEGFTSYQERWYQETRYGSLGYDKELRLRNQPWFVKKYYPLTSYKDGLTNNVLDYLNSGHNEPISVTSYAFKDWASYSVNAYSKGALFFEMLQYIVGDETWGKICHEYFDRWKFKHVNEARFKKVCEDVSGMDLDWFFNQWLHDTVLIDYELKSVRKNRLSDDNWETVAVIKRNQRGIMPVDVQLTTADGETIVKRWDGKDKTGEVRFITKAKAKQVEIDPNDQILDNNRLDNGRMKIEVYPQYPFFYYTPRNAYLLTWRPSAWYNDVDGLRFGFLFNGSYRRTMRNLKVGLWYGINSSELDGLFQYSNPFPQLGQTTRFSISAQKTEGRIDGDVKISWVQRKYRYSPPAHRFSIGFNYSDVVNQDYIYRKYDFNNSITASPDWKDLRVGRAYFNYSVDPRGLNWVSSIDLKVEAANGFSNSDYQSGKLSGQVTFQPIWSFIGLRLRGYAGTSLGDTPLLQDQFWLDGASPRERYNKYYLRSRGAFPAELHYHAPGGGNLRGYFNRPLSGEQIFAFNAEIRKRFRLPIPVIRDLLGNSTLVGFFDTGKIWQNETSSGMLSDAGFGLRIRHRIFRFPINLRFDFPIWLSDPGVDGNGNTKDNFEFRWLLGFSEAF